MQVLAHMANLLSPVQACCVKWLACDRQQACIWQRGIAQKQLKVL